MKSNRKTANIAIITLMVVDFAGKIGSRLSIRVSIARFGSQITNLIRSHNHPYMIFVSHLNL
ncbi:hypothetical protein DERP_012175 [Dermatophagoides pteronyssinus]|uniref:Uncharacterized protein n=1 Tax=Dermatophagoides pteronyssinus TaxID=6956 RepID=A0ABQ8J2C1_DERPT|nr:hypothetical protein DERP_012175 [Dermatophagoides pteronyssinus]